MAKHFRIDFHLNFSYTHMLNINLKYMWALWKGMESPVVLTIVLPLHESTYSIEIQGFYL